MQHIRPPLLAERKTGGNNNMLPRFGKSVFNRYLFGNIFNLVKALKALFIDKALGPPDNSHAAGNFQIRRNCQNRQIRTLAGRQKRCQTGRRISNDCRNFFKTFDTSLAAKVMESASPAQQGFKREDCISV